MTPEERESTHKKGDVFDKDWAYAGEMRVPDPETDTWVRPNGEIVTDIKPYIAMSINNGYREILIPRKKLAETTVTVWQKSTESDPDVIFESYIYTFKGFPDIDRVIAETLKEGALAVKVECTEEFVPISSCWMGCHIWRGDIEIINSGRCRRGDYFCMGFDKPTGDRYITDSDIEAAIAKYLEGQKSSFELTQSGYHFKPKPTKPRD